MRSSSGVRPGVVVVVLEDDDGIREALVELLEDAGLRGVGACDVPEARARIARLGSPVLIADFNVAGETSEGFLEELLASDRAVPILVISASSAARSCAARLGVRFLGKPFEIDRVLEEVDLLIGQAALPSSRRQA